MAKSTRTSALICGDAGEASPLLVARSDIDVKWALTSAEALAVIARAPPDVCITRESFAPDVIRAIGDPHAEPPVLVLLDRGGSDRASSYEPGARAIRRADDRNGVLEACSQLAGLSFRLFPRVRFSHFVEVLVGGERHLVETIDLSASGVCLRDSPRDAIGTEVSISLDMIDPPLVLQAKLVRSFSKNGERRAGFAFGELDAGARERIEAVVEHELEHAPPPSERAIDTGSDSEEGTTPSELLIALAWRAARTLGKERRPPPALRRVAASLTPTERLAASGGDVPVWVERTLDLRLELACARDGLERVLVHGRALAEASASESDERRVQIASIRGALLQAVFVGAPPERTLTVDMIMTAEEHEEPEIIGETTIHEEAPPAPREKFVTLHEHERAYVRRVLDANKGDKSAAAKILGIAPSTLVKKLKA